MAARWLKASKDGKSFRFVPLFVPLEDRSVPATYFVDPLLAGNVDNAAVTFDAGRANQSTGRTFASTTAFALANPTADTFSDFRSALDAAALNADPADTILLATGQIPLNNSLVTLPVAGGTVNSISVTQALTIRGDGAGATSVLPTTDTQFDDGTGAVADDLTSIFRVAGATANLTAQNFRLDGNTLKSGSGFAVQGGASASFDGVAVSDISFQLTGASSGTAIATNAAKSVTFVNGSLSGYGRSGIVFVNTPGSVADSIIVGRGAGSYVNNGIELQSGSVVSVTGNRVAENNGSVGPAQLSSGIIVTDDGAGANPSTALVVGNVFSGNTVALDVGVITADNSTLNAAYNVISGNTLGAFGGLSLTKQDLANNYWGSPTGPFDQAAPGTGKGDAIDSDSKLTVRPFLSYPTPRLSPTDTTSFAAAQANYLNLITTLNAAIDPVGPANLTAAPASVSFTVTFPVPVAANTVEPAALRPALVASDFVVTAPAGETVAVTGSGATYTLTVSGLTGTNYTVTARLPGRAAIDPATGRLNAASNTAAITVNVPTPVPTPNAAPTIAGTFADVTLARPVGGGPIPPTAATTFTVGDDTTPVGSLVVTATTSNAGVVPASSIVLGGSGASRTVSLQNLPGTPGSSAVTIVVTDAQGLATTRSFSVTVANGAPTLTAIPDQSILSGTSASFLPFTVGDDSTPVANITLSVTSSNPAVALPLLDPVVGGGANRTLSVGTVPGAVGTSVITLTATDAQGAVTTRSFAVTVTNTPPTLTGTFADLKLLGTASSGPIPFTVADDTTPAANIVVSVVSSNPAVVPVSSVTLGGAGAARTLTVGGLPGVAGTSTITLTARDANGAITERTFSVTVQNRTKLFAVAADAGSLPEVQVFGADGKARFSFLAFESSFTGGVRVATADFDGDFTDDIVVAAGAGGAARIRVISGATGAELANFFAFDTSFRGGATVATADLTGTGVQSIVAGAGAGGGPNVKVFALNGTVQQSFFAFDPAFKGGVNVAAGDVNKDGKDEIVVGAGVGGAPRVSAFSLAAGSPQLVQNYFAFDSAFRGGVNVTAGTFGIAAAQGTGGNTEVRVLNGSKFLTYESTVTGGVRLGSFDFGGDGVDEILTAAGPLGGARIQGYSAAGTQVLNTFAFDIVARSGYFIG